jgi:hypothetical protein
MICSGRTQFRIVVPPKSIVVQMLAGNTTISVRRLRMLQLKNTHTHSKLPFDDPFRQTAEKADSRHAVPANMFCTLCQRTKARNSKV